MISTAKNILPAILLFLLMSGCGGGDEPGEEKTVEDFDGNVYTTVKIGTQTWMVENLKTSHFRDGTPIPLVTDNGQWPALTTEAYCVYANNEGNAEVYGYLYNWYAVDSEKELAPEGWHVASKAEWDILIDYLGGNIVAGGELKEEGTAHWLSPNEGATNSSGFTAVAGGGRGSDGDFHLLKDTGYWWTGTQVNSAYAYNKVMPHYATGVDQQNLQSKYAGFSVRCIKD